LREGDELIFKSKLSNLTTQQLNGFAQLQILDAFTNEDITEKFGINQLNAAAGYNVEQSFTLNANGSTTVQWNVKVPNEFLLSSLKKCSESWTNFLMANKKQLRFFQTECW
jgi:hypothetical protein